MYRRQLAVGLLVALIATTLGVIRAPLADAALQTWTGTVTQVEDGDTFFVNVGGTLQHIRLAGVNTNEINLTPKCNADEATVRLTALIEGQTVELRANNANSTADGRLIRHVFFNGENMGELMLREGYGTPLIFVDQGEADFTHAYIDTYAHARRSGVGINNPDLCGVGPRSDFPISMTTVGDADGSDFTNVNGEFVRLRNFGSSPFDLTGWQLKDTALEFYAFPAGTAIAPGGVLTIRAGQGANSSTQLFMGNTSPIYSSIDGAFLLDPDGDIRAQNTWPCVGLCGDVPIPRVAITGVNFDIPGIDDNNPNGEYFDLKNHGPTAIDLRDWRFESFPHSKIVDSSILLAPGATVRIRIGVGTDTSSEIFMNRPLSILNNEGDVVMAVMPTGDVAACEAFGDQDCSFHPSKSSAASRGADFNGDGWSDAIGNSPGEDVGSVQDAGAVVVRYGRDAGVRSNEPMFQISRLTGRFLSQSGAITGVAEPGDQFGVATAAGDFNGDGYDDLAVGAPHEDLGATTNAGMVHVLTGGPRGLSSAAEFAVQRGDLDPGAVTAGSEYGASLATGDFNNDGLDDLVIGAPGDNGARGSVAVLYGQSAGVLGGATNFSQAGAVEGTPEANDKFGWAVDAGDFNGDGYDDLVVGAPGEALGSKTDAGLVHVLLGGPGGVAIAGNYSLHQGSGVVGFAEPNDFFGAALAVGNFDNDAFDDVAIGSPGEAIGSISFAGAVIVAGGHPSGLRSGTSRWLAQSGQLPGGAESTDETGATLIAADLNDDGFDDLVVGAPGEAIGSRDNAGITAAIFGPINANSVSFSVTQGGLLSGGSEAGDLIGSSLAALDYNGDGIEDVLIGVPGEDLGARIDAGLVHLVRGAESGVGASTGWSQWYFAGGTESDDRFGS